MTFYVCSVEKANKNRLFDYVLNARSPRDKVEIVTCWKKAHNKVVYWLCRAEWEREEIKNNICIRNRFLKLAKSQKQSTLHNFARYSRGSYFSLPYNYRLITCTQVCFPCWFIRAFCGAEKNHKPAGEKRGKKTLHHDVSVSQTNFANIWCVWMWRKKKKSRQNQIWRLIDSSVGPCQEKNEPSKKSPVL